MVVVGVAINLVNSHIEVVFSLDEINVINFEANRACTFNIFYFDSFDICICSVAAGTVLEVCPGSNVALGLYPSFRAHPIHKLRERGVRVTVSTDDPPFFHTTMEREYTMLADAFEWDDGVFHDIAKTSANAAFCNANTRETILKRLEKAYA